MTRRAVQTVLVLALALSLGSHCAKENSRSLKITTTTSLLGSIARTIGKDQVSVTQIVPGGMCPGHFDVTAQNIKDLADSKVLFNHGWEKWIDKLLAGAGRETAVHTIRTEGNVMVPPVHRDAAGQVAAILCSLDRGHREIYERNLSSYCARIDSAVAVMMQEKKRFASIRVACSELQEEFARWLGLDVIASFARAEDLTPRMLEEVISRSHRAGVTLVLDNLQSGTDAGKIIAQELGARHVILTNFPLTDDYVGNVLENYRKILQAIE